LCIIGRMAAIQGSRQNVGTDTRSIHDDT